MCITQVIEDDKGQIWLNTNLGLEVIDLSGKRFTNFSAKDGLSTLQPDYLIKTSSGDLMRVDFAGLHIFQPSSVNRNKEIPPVYINHLQILNKTIPIYNDTVIHFAYNQNYISFEYVALNFTQSFKNRYAYRLKGLDKNWIDVGERRFTSYANIGAGTYTFQVKASNNEGIWNETPAQITLIISPPWWRTWWFYTLFALFIAGFIYAFMQYRISKIHIQQERVIQKHKATELEMQALRAQMNPHFIFNCLSSINGFILKNESEPASDYLTKFSRLIRMVLTNSKKTFITLEDELEMLRLYLEMERLRFQYSFNYNLIFKNEIDPENIFIPPLLLQPFAENAIWHGLMHKQGQGHLEIALSLEEKILTCMITDNGIGRIKAAMMKSKSAEKQKSMGLQITADRLALLNRDIDEQTFFDIEDITDDKGNAAGTRVILKMHYRDLEETVV